MWINSPLSKNGQRLKSYFIFKSKQKVSFLKLNSNNNTFEEDITKTQRKKSLILIAKLAKFLKTNEKYFTKDIQDFVDLVREKDTYKYDDDIKPFYKRKTSKY